MERNVPFETMNLLQNGEARALAFANGQNPMSESDVKLVDDINAEARHQRREIICRNCGRMRWRNPKDHAKNKRMNKDCGKR